MELSQNSNWRLTKSLLIILGLWPFQQTYFQLLLSRVVIISIISILIPEVIKMISVWGDLKIILEYIQKDWLSDPSHMEKKIMQNYGQNDRRLTHAYAWVILGCTITITGTPFAQKILDYIAPLNESRKIEFLYSVEYFVDPDKYKVPIFIHAYLISPFPSLITVAFDTTYFHCVQHGCSMFAVMRHRMQIITDQTDTKIHGDDVINKKTHQLLIDCIKKHVIILQYCEKLESFYTLPLLSLIINNTLALSITGFHTLIKLNDPPEAFKYGSFTCGCVIHLLFYSYIGQDLTDHSKSIYQFTVSSVAESVQIIVYHFGALLKLSNWIFNSQKLKAILETIRKDWQSDLSDSEMQVLSKYGRNARIFSHFYAYYMGAATLLYLATPLTPIILDVLVPLNESRPIQFLFPTEYFIDEKKYYIPIFIHAYMIGPFPSTVQSAFDTAYFKQVQHACSMFAVVGIRIQNLSEKMNVLRKKMPHKVDKEIDQLLKNSIKKHISIIQYCEALESAYFLMLLPLIIANIVALSITGFYTIVKINEIVHVLKFGSYTLGLVVHLFLFNYPGQSVINHSDSIQTLVYNGNWYHHSPKVQVLFILIMIRSNKTCQLTAGIEVIYFILHGSHFSLICLKFIQDRNKNFAQKWTKHQKSDPFLHIYRIQNLSNMTNNEIQDDISSKKINYLIRKSIKQHIATLQYCQILESTYTTCLLVIVMINTVALSITGFYTVIKINETSEALRFGIYTIGQVVHLYFLSYPGQNLMDYSQSIQELIYDGKWYNLPRKTRELFILIMMRSRKPCMLTAGKMYTMSYVSFSKVIKASISYFTLLTSLQ
ncbi:uncharacterized protein [Chelonus insularis]|uniref:uncharacterized protein n=1 Tax=Chelonus insularis TaxID=460826 RepID=UPI00158E0200|nr:uncharacterized protein LOC118074830 [Chelonus insularis]